MIAPGTGWGGGMADELTREQREKAWWDAWWAEDFSWEGLARKEWVGWLVLADDSFAPKGEWNQPLPESARQATLQDYWRDQAADLITSPDGKRFTCVHMPPAWLDGAPTGKMDWPDDALDQIMIAKLKESGETTLSFNNVITGPDRRIQFQGSVLLKGVSDIEAYERADVFVVFERAAFLRIARFNDLTLSSRPNFDNARFFKDAAFHTAVFPKGAEFREAGFGGFAQFAKVRFLEGAYFGSVHFSDGAFFRDAAIFKAGFHEATFGGKLDFLDAVFSEDAYFDRVRFLGEATFGRAKFEGLAWFDESEFAGAARFFDIMFSRGAYFSGSTFFDDTTFGGTQFSEEAAFDRGKSEREMSFRSAKFRGSCDFGEWEFGGLVDFDKATFGVTMNFRATIFSKLATFREMLWPPDAIGWHRAFDQALFRATAVFTGAGFQSLAAFDGAALERGVVFDDELKENADKRFRRERAAAEETAVFDHARWREEQAKAAGSGTPPTSIEELRELGGFRKTSKGVQLRDQRLAELERGCRVLKQAMERASNKTREQDFYRYELMARRAQSSTPLTERLFSYLYDWVGNYGASIGRPFLAVLGLTLFFAWVYWSIDPASASGGLAAIRPGAPVDPAWERAVSFSASRVFPFGAFEDVSTKWIGKYEEARGGLPVFWVRVLASVQSVLALTLVFVLGLAVRRKFQIG
jgi:hypothetical protein